MKIELTIRQEIKQEIEIEFPYYYKHDFQPDQGESITYGCIYPDRAITIDEFQNYQNNVDRYELELDTFVGVIGVQGAGYDSYLTEPEHKSTKDEFEAALGRASVFITNNFFTPADEK